MHHLSAGGRDALAARHSGYQCPTLGGSLIQGRLEPRAARPLCKAPASWATEKSSTAIPLVLWLSNLGPLPQSAGERGGWLDLCTVHRECLLCPSELMRLMIFYFRFPDAAGLIARWNYIWLYLKHFWHFEMCRYTKIKRSRIWAFKFGRFYIFWRGLPSCTVPSSLVFIKNLNEVALCLDHKSDALKAKLMLTLWAFFHDISPLHNFCLISIGPFFRAFFLYCVDMCWLSLLC